MFRTLFAIRNLWKHWIYKSGSRRGLAKSGGIGEFWRVW
jgi:hypothetical protein